MAFSSAIGLAQGFKVIHQCLQSETQPHTLIQNPADGMFYGTTQGGGDHYPNGSVFKMDSSGNVTTLYSFAGDPDGANPYCPLYLNGDDGLLYGTTSYGGAQDGGAIFKLDTSGGSYALASQALFTCEPTGASPQSTFLKANDGNLYLPMSTCGAASEDGTIDLVDTSLNETELSGFNVLSSVFITPASRLVQGSDNKLYATAPGNPGFCCNYGGVYRIDLGGGPPETVHAFALGEGEIPSAFGEGLAPLCLATDGNFYGTTLQATNLQGSVLFTGTIFKVAQDGTFQTLHLFTGADGAEPQGGVIQASDGDFYGVTSAGGSNDIGVIYRIDSAGNYKVLANILDTDIGQGPWGELLEGSDGKLYGTSPWGYYGYGSIYTIDFTQTIVDIVPNSGPAAGGTPVTIGGTGFVPGASVKVGPFAATNVSVPDAAHIDATTAAWAPGLIVNVKVTLPDATVILLNNGYFYDFNDVPTGNLVHDYVRKILQAGITAGCGNGDYCPLDPVTRAQMAVFLLKAEHGAGYQPPACAGIFGDVACPSVIGNWIEQLYNEHITGGCGNGDYCPNDPVTRAQMAVFLLKTKHGYAYQPPACNGIFGDVPCPSVIANWIEELYNEGVTGGCVAMPLEYCPANPVNRGQMAVFLSKTFGLP
jgi:uncharacterized repeat protein (TIGR03803 family)